MTLSVEKMRDALLTEVLPRLQTVEEERANLFQIRDALHALLSLEGHRKAVESGRRGGLLGGPIRSQRLSPERRKEIARVAAEMRWAGHSILKEGP